MKCLAYTGVLLTLESVRALPADPRSRGMLPVFPLRLGRHMPLLLLLLPLCPLQFFADMKKTLAK